MKKLYSTPIVEVVFVETMQMIAESFGKTDGDVNPNDPNVLSRDGGDWDD